MTPPHTHTPHPLPPHPTPQRDLSGKSCLLSPLVNLVARESVEEEERGVREDQVRVRVSNQQLRSWCERHWGLLLMMTAAAAAALHRRSPGDAPLLDAVRDSGKGIMMQPCRS